MNTVLRLAPWLALVSCFWFVEQTAEHLMQKPAGAAILQVLSNVRVTRSLAFVFGIAGVLFGLQQRGLRRKAEALYQERIRQLESKTGER
jgi:hypothetical protein